MVNVTTRNRFKNKDNFVKCGWTYDHDQSYNIIMKRGDGLTYGKTRFRLQSDILMCMKAGEDGMYVVDKSERYIVRAKNTFSILAFFFNFIMQFDMFRRYQKYEANGSMIMGHHQFFLCESNPREGTWNAIDMYTGNKCKLYIYDKGTLYLHPYITFIYLHILHFLSWCFPNTYSEPYVPIFEDMNYEDMFEECKDIVANVVAKSGKIEDVTDDINNLFGLENFEEFAKNVDLSKHPPSPLDGAQ